VGGVWGQKKAGIAERPATKKDVTRKDLERGRAWRLKRAGSRRFRRNIGKNFRICGGDVEK